MTRVTSRQHPFVQRCRELAAGRGEAGDVLLDGDHLVEEALRAGLVLRGVLASRAAAGLAARAASGGVPIFEGSDDVLAAASPVRSPSAIVAVGRWTPADAVDLIHASSHVLVGLVDIQDPGNVGGIIRTADALGASGVLALDATAHPGGWKALRGAMGSTFRLPVGAGSSLAATAAARRNGVMIAAAVADGGLPIDGPLPAASMLVLVGNEGSGLPRSLLSSADLHLTIPMRNGVNSLNVGVSASLLLWEVLRTSRPGRGSS